MKPTLLTLVNAGAVAVLGVLCILQWRDAVDGEHRRRDLETELAATRRDLAETTRRAAELEGDLERMKRALATAQEEADRVSAVAAAGAETERELRETTDQLQARLADYQDAVTTRDTRIAELEALLEEARTRLAEAADRLRATGR